MYTTEHAHVYGLGSSDIHILNTIANSALLLADIARATKLPRSTVEYRLSILSKRGFVMSSKKGKRHYWKASSTHETRGISGKRYSQTACKIYIGVNELISLWYRITDLPRNTRLIVMQPHRSLALALKKVPREHAIEISRRIKDKSFIVDAIEHEKSARILSVYKGSDGDDKLIGAFVDRLEDIVKVPDNFLDEAAEMNLFTNHIVLIDWDTETGLEIKNEALYKLFLSMFEKIKAYGTRYFQGEYIKKLAGNRQAK